MQSAFFLFIENYFLKLSATATAQATVQVASIRLLTQFCMQAYKTDLGCPVAISLKFKLFFETFCKCNKPRICKDRKGKHAY